MFLVNPARIQSSTALKENTKCQSINVSYCSLREDVWNIRMTFKISMFVSFSANVKTILSTSVERGSSTN